MIQLIVMKLFNRNKEETYQEEFVSTGKRQSV